MQTPRKLKPEGFYTRFDEEWEVVEKDDRTKGYALTVVSWGSQQGRALRSLCPVPQS